MRGRRRPRNRGGRFGRRERLNFTPVIVILCLSVGCGYAAAKYVVDPVVNYVPQLMAEKEQSASEEKDKQNAAEEDIQKTNKEKNIVEDDIDVEQKGEISGYALQFGCYSGKAAAEAVMPTVGVDDLQIIKQNDMYKIVGEIYKTKAEAKAALAGLPDTVNSFVTTVYK